MIKYEFIPDEMMTVILSPILKKRGLDPKLKQNYRPIALATLLSKIFEKLVLLSTINELSTISNQFGFKRRSECEQCIYTLRQIISYCNRKEIPRFMCYLDASRAFECVKFHPLVQKLIGGS